MTRQLMAIFCCVVALAAIVAGCGSSDDDSTASLTKAQFTKQANVVCEEGRKQIEKELEVFVKKIGGPTVTPSDAQVSEIAADIVVPTIKQEAEGLRALGLPSDEEDEVTAMIEAFETGVKDGEENPGEVFGNEGISGSLSDGAAMAAKYGLEGCGQL